MIHPQPPVVLQKIGQPQPLVANRAESQNGIAADGGAPVGNSRQPAAGANRPPKQTPARITQAQGLQNGNHGLLRRFLQRNHVSQISRKLFAQIGARQAKSHRRLQKA